MIPLSMYRDQHVAVFGLGRSGRAAVRALMAGGAYVTAWDECQETRTQALQAGLPVEDLNRLDWGEFAALVLSPGIPLYAPKPHRFVELAQSIGLPVLGDVELFDQARMITPPENRPHLVAVTGSNGKSTVTALMGHILKTSGFQSEAGGNLGPPVLEFAPLYAPGSYIVETSSFQLDLTWKFKPDIAVWLNISPDHLDRHGSMEKYIAAKKKIFARQSGSDYAIIGVDDPYSQRICTELMARGRCKTIPVSSKRVLGRGVYALEGQIYDALEGAVFSPLSLEAAPSLQGQHNWQNAVAAYAAARVLGVPRGAIERAFSSFQGLPHRLEEVGRLDDIRFINDSKATNPASAAEALGTYDTIFWIAGGKAKDDDFSLLDTHLGAVQKAYLIGEAAPLLKRFLQKKCSCMMSSTLDKAFSQAMRHAMEVKSKKPVVLFSPACASFDQFRNFEDRGQAFQKMVHAFIDNNKTLQEGHIKEKEGFSWIHLTVLFKPLLTRKNLLPVRAWPCGGTVLTGLLFLWWLPWWWGGLCYLWQPVLQQLAVLRSLILFTFFIAMPFMLLWAFLFF